MQKELVQVDIDLSDLVPGFLARKRDDLRAIMDAVPKNDYQVITRLAHRLKGEGGSYGFDRMTQLGRVMEEAAQNRDSAAVSRLAEELLKWLDRVEVVYQPSEA
jgi:histidine phosphotransfer protein HptB